MWRLGPSAPAEALAWTLHSVARLLRFADLAEEEPARPHTRSPQSENETSTSHNPAKSRLQPREVLLAAEPASSSAGPRHPFAAGRAPSGARERPDSARGESRPQSTWAGMAARGRSADTAFVFWEPAAAVETPPGVRPRNTLVLEVRDRRTGETISSLRPAEGATSALLTNLPENQPLEVVAGRLDADEILDRSSPVPLFLPVGASGERGISPPGPGVNRTPDRATAADPGHGEKRSSWRIVRSTGPEGTSPDPGPDNEETALYDYISTTYLGLIVEHAEPTGNVPNHPSAIALCPTLLSTLADPTLQRRYKRHLKQRALEREVEGPEPSRLLSFLERSHSGNLLAPLRELVASGKIELIGGPATPVCLPMIADQEALVAGQLRTALDEFERILGVRPRGFRLPHGAWDPRLAPILRSESIGWILVSERLLPVDATNLRSEGITFVTDCPHPARQPRRGASLPKRAPPATSLEAPIAVFHMVRLDLPSQPPPRVSEGEHILSTSPQDVAPVWENLVQQGSCRGGLPAPASARPAGDFRPWLRGENAWIQPVLDRVGRRLIETVGRNGSARRVTFRALSQAAREVLVLQDGRWPLKMLDEDLADRTMDRFLHHVRALTTLLDGVDRGSIDRDFLEERERANALFPILEPDNFSSRPRTK
jgi:hypothetical protein